MSRADVAGSGRGVGQKADDYFALPLCSVCHRTAPHSLHNIGEAAFWGPDDPFVLAAELEAATGDVERGIEIVRAWLREREPHNAMRRA